MKIIKLSKGQETFIDDEDYHLVSGYNWCCLQYAGKHYAVSNTKGKQVRLHRIILGVLPHQQVDHINGNGLNNLRSNLRICEPSDNYKNRKLGKNNTTGYKGVIPVLSKKGVVKFQAAIYVNNKKKHLGTYDTAKDAAKAYNAGAIQYHGDFACLNNL